MSATVAPAPPQDKLPLGRVEDFGVSERALPTQDGDGQPVRFDLSLALDKLPPKKGVAQSSNGMYLLENEQEVFASGFLPLHTVVKENPCLACMKWSLCGCCLLAGKCCGCYFTIPKKNQRLDVCITDKRILLRDTRRKVNPGIKSFWYYLCCCCCVKKDTDEKYEGQVVLNLDDLKDVQMDIQQTKGVNGPMCCPVERNQDQFSMVLYFTKDVGVYHLPTKKWAFADENKTSWMKTDPILAFGSMEEAAEMRRVLEEAVARNQARDAAKVSETKCNLSNGK
ncbi:hypothetical protein DUNSADRAFT_14828 [Dunaliella salina]|uniref:Phospholipid scramblase n=1 Tax=Dunaliella salina TaxID=3046 RepID=A0ABQ7H296_DUNSA|nr:hypothetical protein DUNSADRAFT_14828 [Dunaliella salina]|eukprot:KAF5840972.1 hypothetical protein DUNSADRAFT_14828 [Dunaliella salina]